MLFLLLTSILLLVIVAFVHNVMSTVLSTAIFSRRLSRSIYKLTAVIGTPIHELSHAIACVLFGHKITDIKLIDLSFSKPALGYVNHSWNTRSIYQSVGCFFIAIAPLITASIIVYFSYLNNQWPRQLTYWHSNDILQALTNSLTNAGSWVTEWVVASTQSFSSFGKLMLVSLICFHCIPSKTDFHNAVRGSFIVVLVIVSLVALSILARDVGFNILINQDYILEMFNALTLTASVMILAQLFWLGLFLLSKVGR